MSMWRWNLSENKNHALSQDSILSQTFFPAFHFDFAEKKQI